VEQSTCVILFGYESRLLGVTCSLRLGCTDSSFHNDPVYNNLFGSIEVVIKKIALVLGEHLHHCALVQIYRLSFFRGGSINRGAMWISRAIDYCTRRQAHPRGSRVHVSERATFTTHRVSRVL
jgi:hypothetical protein